MSLAYQPKQLQFFSQQTGSPVLKLFFNGWRTYPLQEGKYTIGRSRACTIQVRCNQVSRQQALLFYDTTGQIKLVDGDGHAPSHNGTYVNGTAIRDCYLQIGDVIHLGSSLVMARLELACTEDERLEAELEALEEFCVDNEEDPPTAIGFAQTVPAGEDSCAGQDNESSTDQIQQLQQDIAELHSQLQHRDKRYIELKENIEKYRQQVEQKRQESAAQIENLTQKLAHAQHRTREYERQYAHLRQEYESYSKRVEHRLQNKKDQAQTDLILEILTVVDSFELAQQCVKITTEEGGAIHEGYQSIYRLLIGLLQRMGLARIEIVDSYFDPMIHEAIACKSTNQVPENHIVEEIQAGYRLGEKVIRPARVVVAKSE